MSPHPRPRRYRQSETVLHLCDSTIRRIAGDVVELTWRVRKDSLDQDGVGRIVDWREVLEGRFNAELAVREQANGMLDSLRRLIEGRAGWGGHSIRPAVRAAERAVADGALAEAELLLERLKRTSPHRGFLARALDRAPNHAGHDKRFIRTGSQRDLTVGLLETRILQAKWHFDEALACLEQLVRQYGLIPELRAPYEAALQQNGRFTEAEALFFEALETGTNDLSMLVEMAKTAHREKNFGIAAKRWQTICEFAPDKETFHRSYVRSLNSNLETERAMAHFEKHSSRFKAFGFQMLKAEILEAENRFEEALSVMTAPWPDADCRPELQLKFGSLVRGCGRLKDAEAHFRRMLAERPNDAGALLGLARTASAGRQYDLAVEASRKLCRLYPDEPAHHAALVAALADLTDVEAARAHLDTVAGALDDAPFFYNNAIKLFEIEHEFDAGLRVADEFLDKFPVGRVPLHARATILEKKANLWRRRFLVAGDSVSLAEYLRIGEEMMSMRPAVGSTKVHWCKTLVAAGKSTEAVVAVDDLSRSFHPVVVDLHIWRENQGGDGTSAKELWNRKSKIHNLPVIQPCAMGELERRDGNPIGSVDGEIRLFTTVRNERGRLAWFLDHYRKLGVDRFFFVDNASTDGTFQYLLDQPNVHVYWTAGDYGANFSGMRWINQLKREHGQAGWTMYVDVDEALVFPGVESENLRKLTAYMERHGHEAFQAIMIDMFSDSATPKAVAEGVDFADEYPFFVNRYHQVTTIHCPYIHRRGGVRQVFGWGENLTKTPIVLGAKVSFLQSSHLVSPARVCDVTGALLHYKLVGNFREEIENDLANNSRAPGCRRRYAHYGRYLDANGDEAIRQPRLATRYAGSEQLVELGLIQCSESF